MTLKPRWRLGSRPQRSRVDECVTESARDGARGQRAASQRGNRSDRSQTCCVSRGLHNAATTTTHTHTHTHTHMTRAYSA